MSSIGLTFDSFCDYVATRGGGYTLWIGAGAAIATTGGRAPSWQGLVQEMSHGMTHPREWDALPMPAKLDQIACVMGHVPFRRELRRRIVNPVLTGPMDSGVMLDQATIAARAHVTVSFNIEMVSAIPFAISKGGGFFYPRPYMEPKRRMAKLEGSEGSTMAPVYFPHGLLDMFGACVLTESEYLLHGMSLAVDTAVSACLGGDLLILGMSLGDKYLRDGILRNRRWMKNVFWVTSEEAFGEWARVASVTKVTATHEQVWRDIAQACLDSESSAVDRGEVAQKDLNAHRRVLGNGSMNNAIAGIRRKIDAVPNEIDRICRELVETKWARPNHFLEYVREIEDLGVEVPKIVKEDPRYRPNDSLAR
jgi:hypothetical protein